MSSTAKLNSAQAQGLTDALDSAILDDGFIEDLESDFAKYGKHLEDLDSFGSFGLYCNLSF